MAKPDRATLAAMRLRPAPPLDLDIAGEFRPAPELVTWARATFIDEGGPLENAEHRHLHAAHIGALWTNVPNGRHMRAIAATCELGKPMVNGRWQKGRAEMQVRQWFGAIPDFILTFDVGAALQCDDATFCALVEHELFHAGQERDEFGAPKFRKSGAPVFAIRGHDIEEFAGVARRYGAVTEDMRVLADALKHGPTIAPVQITRACGACLKAA